jgi:hypothetical protein
MSAAAKQLGLLSLLILALAVWSFRAALGRRKVWTADGV